MPNDEELDIAGRAALPAPAAGPAIARLVAEVYEQVPPDTKRRLLEHLTAPLGALALFAVANGAFARIALQGGRGDWQVRLDDAARVRGADVAALVDFVMQASADAVDGLVQLLGSAQGLAGSALVAVLVSLLLQRANRK